MSKKEERSFEEAIESLEEIVQKLEGENIPLEKAIDLYQKGMSLTNECQKKLKNAEEKMTKIVNEDNNLEDFEVQEDN